ncbi:MAG: hypothetical protein KAH16_03950, partial [Candidatus Izimaplasma sp.]|nr:hypothetical protein [Candidatus Izimaplasma bacterium]
MNVYVVIVLLSVWTIFNLLLRIKNKRKADYSFIVTFVYILGFGYFYINKDYSSTLFEYFSYALIGTFILVLVFKVLVSVFKRDISEVDYHKLEDEITEINKMASLLQKRFISTIEILHDGMCFKDEGEDFFGTDRFIEIFGLKDNVFSPEVFEEKIYKDDLIEYKKILEKTTKKSPIYTTTYRVKNNDNYIWIKEVGRKIIIEKKTSYISIVKPLDIKQYPESEIDVLNELPNHKKMYEEIQKLCRLKTPFTYIVLYLTNVPKINEKYGRDVGDLMMG